MKNIFTAAVVATLFAGAAQAETQLGNGFSLETEVKAERKVDADTSIVTISPEVTYNVGTVAGLELTAGTTLSVWDNTDSFTIDDVPLHPITMTMKHVWLSVCVFLHPYCKGSLQ